jgi:hypothetical protein
VIVEAPGCRLAATLPDVCHESTRPYAAYELRVRGIA